MSEQGCTPQEAKERFGATHYMPMRDGVTPQMWYRRHTTQFNDGTSHEHWQYLTFCDTWHNSGLNKEDQQRLIPID